MRLSPNDYISILKYYNIDIIGMKAKVIKQKAEDILAEKLCRCIKSVENNNSKKNNLKAIAVCKDSVLTKKNLKITKFKCKKSSKLLYTKKNKHSKVEKTRKQLSI